MLIHYIIYMTDTLSVQDSPNPIKLILFKLVVASFTKFMLLNTWNLLLYSFLGQIRGLYKARAAFNWEKGKRMKILTSFVSAV